MAKIINVAEDSEYTDRLEGLVNNLNILRAAVEGAGSLLMERDDYEKRIGAGLDKAFRNFDAEILLFIKNYSHPDIQLMARV